MKTFIITILSLASFSVAFSPLYALELVKQDEKKIVKVIEGDFDGDGVADTATLMSNKSKADEYPVNYDLKVEAKRKTFLIKNALVGEGSLFCGLEKITVSSKIASFIGISYLTGAHSWGLYLYAFDGKSIKEVEEFGSDAPSIQLKDVDKDGKNEIVVAERDWDSEDPVKYRIIDTFKYNGKKWKLVSEYETKTKRFIPIVKKR